MCKVALLAPICLALCVPLPAIGTTWYVDGSVAKSGDGTSWEAAFKRIQEGIDAAVHGHTVIVAKGTYFENIKFNGKNIVLRSTNPLDPNVVASTVIDGSGKGPVIAFHGAEKETCVVSGFTIRNGEAIEMLQGVNGGGIFGGDRGPALATIENNIITGNSAANDGGGIYFCAGTIRNNVISNNSARGWGYGGGLCDCNATIENNVISSNSGYRGGGLSDCDRIIRNNTISGNSAAYGGGFSQCEGLILNNLIWGNSASERGGGLLDSHGTIQNNTIVSNSAVKYSGGVQCEATIRNCIIWGNTANEDPQVRAPRAPMYSCIQGWTGGGEGNIAEDPKFVSLKGGNLHVTAESPCIDRGVNYYWFSWPQRDADGNCRLIGESVDMGCYEYASSLDSDGDLLSDSDEAARGTDPQNQDRDGDGLRDGLEILRGTDPLVAMLPGIIQVPADILTIQRALCLAMPGERIIVSPGTYPENLVFCGADVMLTSSEPTNPDIVASTIIEGRGLGTVVAFTGRETEACVLSGFTIQNGRAWYGGGICGRICGLGFMLDRPGTDTGATIENNVVAGNSADYGGGGIAFCDGTIRYNTIKDNHAASAYWGYGYGAGLYGCDGRIHNDIISGNSAELVGGGMYYCHGLIQNCLITDNSADSSGGGLFDCRGTLENDTIAANSGGARGGGLSDCEATMVSCIVWGNSAAEGPQIYASYEYEEPKPTYCCIGGWTKPGTGNISEDPLFDADFRLYADSPCVDAGLDVDHFVLPQRDLGGNCRVVGKAVAMGCYEYGSSPDSDGDLLCDVDESAAGTDPAREDSDGDGLLDGLEILRGTDPSQFTPPGIIRIPENFPTIQKAIRVAVRGDEIIVEPGTYRENLQFFGVDAVLRSSNPEDPTVVASTILDGGGAGPVVSFAGTETEQCVLAGFTIRNGSADYGAGIRGCFMVTGDGKELPGRARATIRRNFITLNSGARGGGICFCNGAIEDNIITKNTTWCCGAGVSYCDGLIRNNTIVANTCTGEISTGSGLAFCSGTVSNNIICGNTAGWGGGLVNCHGIIQNNLIAHNSSTYVYGGGGGLVWCCGIIRNNTIYANRAVNAGGGLHECLATIENCIIWGNVAPNGRQLYQSWNPIYSCIQSWTEGGQGNISQDPRLLDPDGPDNNATTYADNDYRLSPDSPCRDAGNNDDWMWNGVDLDGNPRISQGTVDMGAYEHLFEITKTPSGEIQLKWSSRPGESYIIWSCADLCGGGWNEETTIPSQGNSTTWTGPETSSPCKFYRIGIE